MKALGIGANRAGLERNFEPVGRIGRDHALKQVGLTNERGDELAGRRLVDLLGRANLLQHAIVHDRDAVAHGERLFLIVRHVEERDVKLALEALELELHLLAQLEIERTQRLVEQQDLGSVDQGAGDSDALLLATGQLVGLAPLKAAELHQIEHFHHALANLVLGNLLHLEAVGDVVEDGHVRKQRVALEHGVHVALERLLIGHVGAGKQNLARRGLLKAGNHAQRRRLARAGRAQNRQELALLHIDGQVLDHMVLAVELVDVLNLDEWFGIRHGNRLLSIRLPTERRCHARRYGYARHRQYRG